MPYHILSAPCLRIIQDKNNGLTSLMDIVDTAYIEKNSKPSLPAFKLFSKWGKSTPEHETEKFDVKLSLSGPSQSRKKQIDKFNVVIPENASGITIILELDSITVMEVGLWFIHISVKASPKSKWKEVCSLPFKMQHRKTKLTEQIT